MKTFRLLLIATCAVALLSACRKSELPRLFPVPAAQLVDDAGRSAPLASLRGNVVIYDFIFSRCGGTCPLMTRHMQALIAELPKDEHLRFVSISVDPTHDTPSVLSAYAAKVRKDPRWTFLTGDPQTILDVSVKGFKLAAGENTNVANEPILHSTKFVLVDRTGMIRNYYDSSDRAALEKLRRDAEDLLDE